MTDGDDGIKSLFVSIIPFSAAESNVLNSLLLPANIIYDNFQNMPLCILLSLNYYPTALSRVQMTCESSTLISCDIRHIKRNLSIETAPRRMIMGFHKQT